MANAPITLREDLFDNLNDCQRIVASLNALGLTATIEQAQLVWARHSFDREAGWLGLPESDEEIWDLVEPYIDGV